MFPHMLLELQFLRPAGWVQRPSQLEDVTIFTLSRQVSDLLFAHFTYAPRQLRSPQRVKQFLSSLKRPGGVKFPPLIHWV